MTAALHSEAAAKADFSRIRYAQCWEDADVLLRGLRIAPGDRCLAIASAGDNAFAMLAQSPEHVVAIDLSFPQIALVHLKVAAYRTLSWGEMRALLDASVASDRARASAEGDRKEALYERLAPTLPAEVRTYWNIHRATLRRGVNGEGRFERYFALFRRWILPLIHSRTTVAALLRAKTHEERATFYERSWNTPRYRFLCRVFFSRFVMGRLGRDPRFFDYVDGPVAERLLRRAEHALVALDPSVNPYLQMLLVGARAVTVPYALREEHFASIRANLDRLEIHHGSIESYAATHAGARFDACNLSDIFEYCSEAHTEALLRTIAAGCADGARLVYWNMLAPRSRPETLAATLVPEEAAARALHAADRAFFYSRLVVETVGAR